MALRAKTKPEWEKLLTEAGVPREQIPAYADNLVKNRITNAEDLTRELLKELNINNIGDQLCILKHITIVSKEQQLAEQTTEGASEGAATSQATAHHKPQINIPQLKSELTHPEFRKFKVDWSVYKQLTNVPSSQLPAQIYSACDANIQTTIINTVDNFFSLSEKEIMEKLEKIVTKRSNPAVHRLAFSNISRKTKQSASTWCA